MLQHRPQLGSAARSPSTVIKLAGLWRCLSDLGVDIGTLRPFRDSAAELPAELDRFPATMNTAAIVQRAGVFGAVTGAWCLDHLEDEKRVFAQRLPSASRHSRFA